MPHCSQVQGHVCHVHHVHFTDLTDFAHTAHTTAHRDPPFFNSDYRIVYNAVDPFTSYYFFQVPYDCFVVKLLVQCTTFIPTQHGNLGNVFCFARVFSKFVFRTTSNSIENIAPQRGFGGFVFKSNRWRFCPQLLSLCSSEGQGW